MDFYGELTRVLAALQGRRSGRLATTFEGGIVQVVSREALIALKLAAGRPQDLVDIQRLEEANRG